MRAMSLQRRLLIFAGAVVGLAAVYFGVSVYTVNEALTAEVSEIEERPEELGLAYEEVEFTPRGWPEITLRGWWLPAEGAKGAVVRVHGVDSNRGSRLGLIQAMVEGGYSVLTFDLRGHGLSDDAQMGAGLHERDDVLGAVDYLLSARGIEPGEVLLYGISFGAAIALMAGVEEPAVAGVFADSSFALLSDLITQEAANRTPLPGWSARILWPGLVWMAQAAKGIDIDAVRPVDAAARYRYPLGLAHCRADERVTIRHLARIRQALQAPPRLTAYDECEHSNGWDDYPEHYEAVMLDYFDERLGLLE